MRIGSDRSQDEPQIDLVPLIDVILVLIIFFVVTTTFDARSTLQLLVAHCQRPEHQRAAAFVERAGQCRWPLFHQ